jgi:hypothetical protein
MRSTVAFTDRDETSLTHASPSLRTTPPSSPTVAGGGSGAAGAVRQYRYVGLTTDGSLDGRKKYAQLELDEVDIRYRNDHVAAQHDALVEHATDEITQD